MTEQEELELCERDERIKEELKYVIDCKIALARQFEEDARQMRNDITRITKAINDEKWWELDDILEERDIESLCNISPKGLLNE